MRANAIQQYEEAQAVEEAARKASTAKRLQLRAGEAPIRRREAKTLAITVARDAIECGDDDDGLKALCEGHDVGYPESKFGRKCTVARLTSSDWWGKKLRVTDWRKYEMRQIATASVRRYCSEEIAMAHRWHRELIRQLLDNLYAAREDDMALFTLLELAEKSKSNPVIRLAQMVRQAKGMARLAVERGWTWAFWTLTCPSKFHSTTTLNDKYETRVPNSKWNGASPRDGQRHLRTVYERFRSKLARDDIDYMAVRVAEPHLDGCPHWHGIVWCAPDDLPRIHATLSHYGLQMDGDQKGARRHRVKWRKYRPLAYEGTEGESAEDHSVNAAIAYIIAYIGKNIEGKRADGKAIGDTHDRDKRKVDGDTVENAARATAWASLWGIRQFQFNGGPKIGPYEELRRLRTPHKDDEIEEARKAADVGDFAEYAKSARQLELKVWAETSSDRLASIEKELREIESPTLEQAEELLVRAKGAMNRWGEPSKRWVIGVRAGSDGPKIKTRHHTWRVVSAYEFAQQAPERRELLEQLEARLKPQRDAAATRQDYADVCSAYVLACDFQRESEASRLGPGSITVRVSGQLFPGPAYPPAKVPNKAHEKRWIPPAADGPHRLLGRF